MTYATVTTTTTATVNGLAPRMYTVRAADEHGNAQADPPAVYASILFADGDGKGGCSETDLIGVVMHRLAARAQVGNRPDLERALQALDGAMQHLTDKLEIAPMESMLYLTAIAGQAVPEGSKAA